MIINNAVTFRFRYGAFKALHTIVKVAYRPLGTLTSSVSTQKLSKR